MKISDMMTLVGARFKTRKLRMIVSVVTMSVLFGLVIGVIMIVGGTTNVIERLNTDAYGDGVLMSVSYSNETGDTSEDKAKAYVEQFVQQYNGEVMGRFIRYEARGEIVKIEGIEIDNSNPDFSCWPGCVVGRVDSISDVALGDLIEITERKDNVIQVVLPFEQAATLLGLNTLNWSAQNTNQEVREYFQAVRSKAIGYQFEVAVVDDNGQQKEYTFEIVGLLQSRDKHSFNYDIDLLQMLMYSDKSFSGTFIVNPNSTAARELYTVNNVPGRISFLVKVDNATIANQMEQVEREKRIRGDSPLSIDGIAIDTRMETAEKERIFNQYLVFVTIVLSIVSVIIMAGTVSRIISDESNTMALYRTLGARNGEIIVIYLLYMLVLGILVIICSTLIGFAIALGMSAYEYETFETNAMVMYGLENPGSMLLLSFNEKIVVVYGVILGIEVLSLFLLLPKMFGDNIVKNLKTN